MIERIIAYPTSGGDLGSEEWRATVAETREYIVRCRDCRFSLAHGNGCMRNQDIYDVEPDGFCAWGERKVVEE